MSSIHRTDATDDRATVVIAGANAACQAWNKRLPFALFIAHTPAE